MPTALDELTNAVVPFNGRVYVLGGRVSPSGGTTNTVEMYDPVAGTWTAAPSMPTAREQASASGSGNNLYVAGGLGTGAVTAVLEVLSETRTFAYITNQTSNDVAVIDVDATNAFTGGGGLCNPADRPCTLVTRIPVGSDPFGVAVHPAGTFVYVTNVLSGTVSVIDTASNTVVATVPVGATPAGVAINPAGTLVYVVNSDYPVGTISVIDTATNTVTATVTVGANPYGLAVHPAGTSVYVVNDMSNTVSVIDTATKTVTATIPVGARPVSVAFTPSGAFAYVTNGSQSVSVIDTETRTVVHTIPEGAVFFDPYGVAVDPTGAYVYVTNSNSGSLAKIATASNTVVATVPTPGAMNPAGVAVDPSGSHVYVAGVYCNCVLVYDAATLTLTSYVAGMGLAPTAFGQFIGLGSTPTESNTPVGTNIVVTPADTTTGMTPATVTFASVTQAGMTTLTTSSSGPTPPSGFALVGAYYQLASTAVFVAPVRVCIAYNPSGIADETQLKLFHFETSQWVNVTSGSVDNVNHIICGQVSSLSPFAIFKPQAISLTSLGPVTVWVGLKNSDDIGIRFDLRAEVYRNGAQLVGSGEVAGVAGGSSGFNNAKQNVIPLTLNAGTTFASGDTLSVKVLARNACTGSGKNSGTARLWYNDNAADSRFAATIGSPATYYLLSGLGLGGSPGSGPKNTIDVAAGAKCSAYKMFGTWSSTLP
jgi:YVTN family beta-propeller protein